MEEKSLQYYKAFISNDQKIITEFYHTNKQPFTKTIFLKFGISDKDTIADIYQEAICRMWENIQRGKLAEQALTSTLFSYLIGIGEFVVLETLRSNKEIPLTEELQQLQINIDIEDSAREYDDLERAQSIQEAVNNMGEPCAPLLLKFYWEKLSMKEIAIQLGYSGADSAKTQKNKCMNKLKAQFRSKR